MLTIEHDVNVYAPNNDEVKLIAYQWVMYDNDEENLSLHPDAKWTAGRGEEIETHLTLTVKDNLPEIRYIFHVLEDDETLDEILDDCYEDVMLEEYDSWHGVWDDFAGENAPAIIREWALALPEYEDGMTDDE
jgi:hypothetical protein